MRPDPATSGVCAWAAIMPIIVIRINASGRIGYLLLKRRGQSSPWSHVSIYVGRRCAARAAAWHDKLGRSSIQGGSVSRAQRLLDLIQELRGHRRAVSGAALAEGLGISLRTLYRDIETLKAQGADIDGEPGVGYILRPGYMLPPLMFSQEEIEAIVLGSRWVADRADTPLGNAARAALAKIAAVLPDDLKKGVDATNLLIGPGEPIVGVTWQRSARRSVPERKLRIAYVDGKGAGTRRTIWPFALAFFDRVRVVVAWCETREGYRHFRTDRIGQLTLTDMRYPRRRLALLNGTELPAFRAVFNSPRRLRT